MKIEAYFSNTKKANETVDKLKRAGFNNAHFDLNEHYMEDRNIQRNLAGTEGGSSLSDLVLKSGDTSFTDRSKAPIAAANPAVSGMGNMEEIADINCKVVVEADDNQSYKAKNIIKKMGGDFDNPNIEAPEIEGDADRIFDMQLDKFRRNL